MGRRTSKYTTNNITPNKKKLFEKIVEKRLRKTIEEKKLLNDSNFGFRIGVGTTEAIYTMKNVIDMSNLQNKPLYTATLDVEKAYDSVPFKAISVSLRRLKVPKIIIKLIESLNSDRDLTIKTPHGETLPITPTRGLPQGSIFSPNIL